MESGKFLDYTKIGSKLYNLFGGNDLESSSGVLRAGRSARAVCGLLRRTTGPPEQRGPTMPSEQEIREAVADLEFAEDGVIGGDGAC